MSDTVAAIEAFTVPYREPNDHGSTRWVCLVRLVTRDGIVGWGEGVTLFEEAARATAALVRGLQEHLLGTTAGPLEVARAITDRAWWYGDTGIACFARAAIDMALWDIRGHREGQNLLALLGGAVHASLPVVLSTHATSADLVGMSDKLAHQVRDARAEGIKIGFGKAGEARLGYDEPRDVEFVRSMRAALGPGPRIMIDVGARLHWTVEEAVSRTLAFEEHDLAWIEEPLGADDPPGYARLKAAVSTPIAYGEREWTVRGVERILATGTVDVVGIDPGRLQGVSGFARAAELVQAAEVQANAHAFSGPLVYAASTALSLASPACHQLEVPPYRNELYERVGEVPAPVSGRVTGSTAPGLGVVVDESAVRRMAVA